MGLRLWGSRRPLHPGILHLCHQSQKNWPLWLQLARHDEGLLFRHNNAKIRRDGSQGCQGDEGRSWGVTWELAPAGSTETGDKRRVPNAQSTWRTRDLDEQCTK